MSRTLDVYLHNKYAGKLIQNDAGALSLSYDTDYVKERRPAFSLSLPLRSEPYEGDVVRAFFSGILPDDIIRHPHQMMIIPYQFSFIRRLFSRFQSRSFSVARLSWDFLPTARPIFTLTRFLSLK